ncbi:MAG: tetratricopeptide repeat-containing protein [Anaerolineales bacterium]
MSASKPTSRRSDETLEALAESRAAIRKAIDEIVAETRTGVRAAVEAGRASVSAQRAEGAAAPRLRPPTLPHAFVVMPFGKKKGANEVLYDFNAIYEDLIKPALLLAGFEPFRADESTQSGDILTDMFQELLLADLVVCDLSIDNANVFYEVGIRHAFRKRGVIHIQSGRAYLPFDIFNVRTLPYHTTPEGVPDPAHLEKDRQAIARLARDTYVSSREAVHSPVFNLLPGLSEPDRKALRTPLATGFWRQYHEWLGRLAVARRQKRVGDILLLTEEITHPMIREEAIGEAGRALADLGRHPLALLQYQKGLALNPENTEFRRREAFHLNRLGQVDEAIVKIEGLIRDAPADSEAIAYLGRIYKEMWLASWRAEPDLEKRLRLAFDSYHWLLKSFYTYLKGFRLDLNQFYPGINALTLGMSALHLADRFEDRQNPDPDITFIRQTLPDLRGALEFSLESRAADDQADYWTLVSLAELRLLTSESPQQVERAYRKALPASHRKLFNIQSSIQQLEILQALEMRPAFVETALRVLREEIERLRSEDYAETPDHQGGPADIDRRAFVFSGLMIDPLHGKEKNFPPILEAPVRQAILQALDRFQAGPEDLGLTTGLAAGGDLLFAECCFERGMPVKVYMPLPDADYVREFVSPCGEAWVERFYKARGNPLLSQRYQAERLGPPRPNDDVYERNNRWVMYSALGAGAENVRLIALCESRGGRALARDAALVHHMIELAREAGVPVEQINPVKLALTASGTASRRRTPKA